MYFSPWKKGLPNTYILKFNKTITYIFENKEYALFFKLFCKII